MNSEYNKLMKFMRVKEGVKLEALAKKLFVSKSQLSLLENNKRTLSLSDFLRIMSSLGCEVKILKDGKDCMNMMKNNLIKNELGLTDLGYFKDYPSKDGELIRVEFETFNNRVIVARDMLDKTKYLSTEKHNYYELNYNGDDGYGRFYQEYYDANDVGHWEIIIDMDLDNNKAIVLDNIYKLFDDTVVDEIIKTYKMVISR